MKGFYKISKYKTKKLYKNKNYKRKENKIKMNTKSFTGFAVLGIIGLAILFLFIAPWLYFWLAYFGGWIAKITIGNYLVEGFALLGLTIPLEKIPLIAGFLGWFGSFFKSIHTASNLNNE